MKPNQTPTVPHRVTTRRRFALNRLSLAVCVAMSGAAWALPQGANVVAGSATIASPTPGSQVITQTTQKAIIDWRSFSIAGDEKVRFNQPSASSITLNRVVGYDPSAILGQMSSNGRVFLLNSYGVVFGANARVDVGGLVASSLSLANDDFIAGRYSLTSVDRDAPTQRGAVRNDGVINAPGGTVALVGPSVTNTGSIVADRGRIGLAAAQSVSVDVEGDGLVFFRTAATEATNRLDQLGRIQANGGSIEMRAAARAAFADTVLNLEGTVQARSLGMRDGKVVIDGGAEGIVRIAGIIDATGTAAAERGGAIGVEGQRVLLDNGSVLDASGRAGGGDVRVGGDFHGANPAMRNADVTGVASTAVVRADALDAGDGGRVAIWSDGTTRFYGRVSAEGGKDGGNGGFVEVSGKKDLLFRGDVSTAAPKGQRGTLLLDPSDIFIVDAASSADDAQLNADNPTAGDAIGLIKAGDGGASAFTISSHRLEQIGAANDLDLRATNSISIADLITQVTIPHALTILGGSLSLSAGAGGISVAGTTALTASKSITIDATTSGSGPVAVNDLTAGLGITLKGSSITLNGALNVTTAGHGVSVTGPTTLAAGSGSIALTGSNAANDVTMGTVNGAQALNIGASGGNIVLGAVGGSVPLVSVTLTGSTASLADVTTTHAQNYGGVTTTTLNGALSVNTAGFGITAGATQLGAGGGAITLTGSNAANDVTLGTVNGSGTLAITAGGGDVVLGVVGNSATPAGVTVNSNTVALHNVKTDGDQIYNATVSAAGVTLDAGTGSISAVNPGNDFTGTITLKASGPSISIQDANNLTLAAPTLGNTSLTAIATGVLTLPGPDIDAGTGSIDLRSNGGLLTTPGKLTTANGAVNLFGFTGLSVTDNITTAGGNVTLGGGAANGVTISANKTVNAGSGSIAIDGGTGAVDLNNSALITTNATASAVTIRHAGTVTLGDITATSGTVQIGVGGDVTGNVTQQASTTLAAATFAASTAGSIDLGSGSRTLSIDNLGTVQRGGALTLHDTGGTGLVLTGDITAGATNNAVTITTSGALSLGNHDITITGGNDLVLTGTSLSQGAGSIKVGGLASSSTITATAGTIDLQSPTNDFGGTVDLASTGAAAVRTAHNLLLNSFTGNGITAIAGDALTVPAGAITTSGGPIDLEALNGTLATQGTLTSGGGAIKLVGAGGLTVGHDLHSGNGAIALTGGGATGVSVATLKLVDAGSGTLSIDGGTGPIQLHDATLSTTNATANAVTLRDASSVAIGTVNASSGTLQIGVGSDVTGAVTQNAGTSIHAGTLAASTAGSVDLGTVAPLTVPSLGAVTTTGPLSINDAVALAFTGDTAVTGATVTLSSTGAITLGAHNLTTTGAASNLAITGAGVSQGSGAIVVGGTTTVDAGSGSILLASAGNHFAGAVTLATTAVGGTVSIHDQSALQLAALAGVSATSQLSAIADGTLTTTGGFTTTGAITLQSLGGAYATTGNLGGSSVTLAGSAGLAIGHDLTATTVSLNASNAAITQSAGVITSTGATTFAAGTGAVTLDQPNAMVSVGGTGGAVSLTSATGLALDAIHAASLALHTGANGSVTQNGAAVVSGATSTNAGSGNVLLTKPGNDFGSVGATGTTVSITDVNTVALDAINATTLTVNTTAGNGAVTQNAALAVSGAAAVNAGGGAVTLGLANNFGSIGAVGGAVTLNGAGALVLDTINAASLGVTATGNITQNAATTVTVSGISTFNAGAHAIALTQTGNDFQGAVGLNNSGANAVAITDTNALVLGTSSVGSGTLTLTAGGNITQTGAITQAAGAGAISINGTGAGLDVLLDTQANDLSGGLNLVGGVGVYHDIGLRNVNAAASLPLLPTGLHSLSVVFDNHSLALPATSLTGNLVVTANGVTQTGALTVAGTTTITAGANPITLTQAGNDFQGAVGLNNSGANAVAITDTNALVLGTSSVGSGTLTLTAGGNITQTGAITQAAGAGAISINGTGAGLDVLLDTQANDLSGGLNLVGGVGVYHDIGLRNVNAAASLPLLPTGLHSLSVVFDNHSLALPATSLTGNLVVTANGVTQTGALTVAGTTTITAGANPITLTQAGNDFQGAVGLNNSGANAVAITDTNALVLGPSTLGTGGFTVLAGGPVSQTGAIAAPGITTITAGGGAVTLANAGNDFASVGVTGGAVSIADANAILLNAISASSLSIDTSAGNGAVTQSAPLVVSGATTIHAGSGPVTLANPANNFGSVGATGGTVTLVDTNGIALDAISASSLAITAGGAVVQNAAAHVTGSTLVSAGGNAVTLANAGNDFNSVAVTGGAVSVTDSNALVLGAMIASSLTISTGGALTQTAAALVSGATSLNAGVGPITLTQAGNHFASLSATGGAISITDATALVLAGVSGNSLDVDTTAANGAITQTGPVVLTGAASVRAGSGAITLANAGNDFPSVSLAGSAIDVATANALTVTALTSGANQPVRIGAGGHLTLPATPIDTGTANLTLASGGALDTQGTLRGTNVALTSGGAMAIANDITALGTFALTASNASIAQGNGAIVVGGSTTVNAGSGDITLNQAGNDFQGSVALTGGAVRVQDTNNLTIASLVNGTNRAVSLVAGGSLVLPATPINTGSADLTLQALGGALAITGNLVGNNVTLSGSTGLSLGANVASSGAQTYITPLLLTANVALDAGASRIDLLGGVNGGGHDLTLSSANAAPDAIHNGAAITNTAHLAVQGRATLGADVSTSVSQTYAAPVQLAVNTTLGGVGTVAFAGTVDSAAGLHRNLSIPSATSVTFGAAVGAGQSLGTVAVNGPVQIGANVTTSAGQLWSGAATLSGDATLTGTSITFGSTLDGARALTVNSPATTFTGTVGGTTALASLSTDAAGTTQIGGNVRTTGAQTYADALQLLGSSVLDAGAAKVDLRGAIDGAGHALTVDSANPGADAAHIAGSVANVTQLAINGKATLAGGTVTTTGSQAYNGALTLAANLSLTGTSLSVTGPIDGAFNLATTSTGVTTFASPVGATAPLASLTVTGAAQLGGGNVTTSGAQSYSGAVIFTGAGQLTTPSLTLSGPVSGATDLTLTTDTLNGATAMAGTGTLAIKPLDPARSISIATAVPGTLQITQAQISGATGFAAHVIGVPTDSGAITAGNVVLKADTTLQTGSGDITLGGSVDGAVALALNTGGTTTINGSIGAVTPLRSLVTDNSAAAPDWNGTSGERTWFKTADSSGAARVITTGAQTYNDPVTADVPLSLSGGAITALQAGNAFAQPVTVHGDTLHLVSTTDLHLATAVLANGGDVQTDGILHLGTLQLGGSTLSLVAKGTPTAVPLDPADPEFTGKSVNGLTTTQASATIVQDPGGTLASAVGSLLALRATGGGSIVLDRPGNTLLGGVSAVTGALGETDTGRFTNSNGVMLRFVQIASSEIHASGKPNGDPALLAAGIEGDVVKLTADTLTTGSDGLIRARLPFSNLVGSKASIPGITFVLSDVTLTGAGHFGTPTNPVLVQVGATDGGFVTARPHIGGDNAAIFIGGSADVRPFYDGTGKLAEIRVFYNGDAPRTPQEAGALAAVIALIEDARHARFEEAVRTENVTSRLRSGVIAEVGAGRPATVGRESIRLPENCEIKPGALQCADR